MIFRVFKDVNTTLSLLPICVTQKYFYTCMNVFHPRSADCYSGDGGLKTYNRDGPTRQCFTSNYKPCDLTSCESEPCAGTENTIFVYELGECEYVQ